MLRCIATAGATAPSESPLMCSNCSSCPWTSLRAARSCAPRAEPIAAWVASSKACPSSAAACGSQARTKQIELAALLAVETPDEYDAQTPYCVDVMARRCVFDDQGSR